MRLSRATTSLTITQAVLALALTACTAGPGVGAPAAELDPESTAPSADGALMPPDHDARHLCGQVSALEGIRFRSDWEHDQGLIDDAAYASRVAALEDGWTDMVIGTTEVSEDIKSAQQALGSGGIGYDNTEFQSAVGEVANACDAAGSLVSVSALPGQGG